MTEQQVGPISGAPGWNMYVFRDGRHSVAGPALLRQLADAIRAVSSASTAQSSRSTDHTGSAENARNNHLIEALLRAGELECTLADAGDPGEARVACVTDGLAAHLVGDP